MRAELENARGFDQILVNSIFSRESVLRAYGLEAEVCYLGVNTNFWRPITQEKKDYVVGLGNIDTNKGLDRAVKALGAVPAEIRPRLKWIGNYEEPTVGRHVKELSTALNVEIDYHIDVSDHELRDILSSALCMIYTSRLEPFGLAPLEACACGTPVVAIAEGGVRESMRNGVTGFVVATSDPSRIADCISKLLLDPAMQRSLSESCRKHVEKYWNRELAIDRLESYLADQVGSFKGANLVA